MFIVMHTYCEWNYTNSREGADDDARRADKRNKT